MKRLLAILLLLTGSALAQHSATVTYTASSDAAANPALGYNVYRTAVGVTCTPAPTTWTKLNSTPVLALSYVDSTVVPGAYCYTVTATLNGVESVKAVPADAQIPLAAPGSVITIGK